MTTEVSLKRTLTLKVMTLKKIQDKAGKALAV